MARHTTKYVKSKYKHVEGLQKDTNGDVHWCLNIKGVGRNKFKTERDAALAADKYLISVGKPPVNILIKRVE